MSNKDSVFKQRKEIANEFENFNSEHFKDNFLKNIFSKMDEDIFKKVNNYACDCIQSIKNVSYFSKFCDHVKNQDHHKKLNKEYQNILNDEEQMTKVYERAHNLIKTQNQNGDNEKIQIRCDYQQNKKKIKSAMLGKMKLIKKFIPIINKYDKKTNPFYNYKENNSQLSNFQLIQKQKRDEKYGYCKGVQYFARNQ